MRALALLLAGTLAAQSEDLAALRARAAGGLQEPDLLVLLRELESLASVEPAARPARERELGELLALGGPDCARLPALRRDAAQALLATVPQWERARWPATAAYYAAIAARFDPVAAQPLLERLAARRVRAPALGTTPRMTDWFPVAQDGWRVTPELAISPELDPPFTRVLETDRVQAFDAVRLSVEIEAAGDGAKGALAFATDGPQRGFVVDLEHQPAGTSALLARMVGKPRVEELQEARVALTRKERAGWVRLEVEIRQRDVTVLVAGVELFTHPLAAAPPSGKIALFVSGDSARKAPVRFRDLRCEPLR